MTVGLGLAWEPVGGAKAGWLLAVAFEMGMDRCGVRVCLVRVERLAGDVCHCGTGQWASAEASTRYVPTCLVQC